MGRAEPEWDSKATARPFLKLGELKANKNIYSEHRTKADFIRQHSVLEFKGFFKQIKITSYFVWV